MTCVDEQLSGTLASVTHKYETVTTLDLFITTGIYLSHFKVLLQVQHHQPIDLLLNSLCCGYLVLYLVIFKLDSFNESLENKHLSHLLTSNH